ncbi:uncharacterized protein LOC116737259 [Xiphophorus hellerii]|uniref:uncharacterized protein LOC116737259 n=1 Tax=Xiphophorus hellerii TaxID=8084 RepID=UPI0013B46538|nr:uncharacterized protein LOC116737259 [Xiphophorus hellerii]
MLLPSTLSTSASFTISLFQMINYSVVYLHCDLSVCLRNHSDCERQCLQQRSVFPSEGADTVTVNLRNCISFGPVLKQAKNSTFPLEIDPSQLDLVLVFVSLVVGFSLISLLLLLVWLAYHRQAIWLLHSAAPSQACCGCLRLGGDLSHRDQGGTAANYVDQVPPPKIAANNYISQQTEGQSIILGAEQKRPVSPPGVGQNTQ